MTAIQVRGLHPLCGSVKIQGSKNAILPMMAAALLAKGTTVFHNVPAIADVYSMLGILKSLGCACTFRGGTVTVDAACVGSVSVPEEYVGAMRSSVMVLGPLIGRMGEAVSYYPGGCVIGKRPIDLHLSALRMLGAEICEAGGMILARSRKLCGNRIVFRFPSVGATENAVMAAVLAEGTTVLENCAREPEIAALCGLLTRMGARIYGAGSGRLTVEGVKELSPCEYEPDADRICAGTYLAAGALAGGEIEVLGVDPAQLSEPLRLLEAMGAEIFPDPAKKAVRLCMKGRPKRFFLRTGPYPAFPTDLQSVFLAAACAAEGESRLTEGIFEERFAAARMMRRFGARIRIEDRTATVTGSYPLKPAVVSAPDLRGGAALLAAALAADGESVIEDSGHIVRGYEDICRDLRELGAEVWTINQKYG